MSQRDYYEVLGVPRDADGATLKAAFRAQAMEHHPDRNGGSEESAGRFKEINEAYSVLSDPQKRAAYDRFGFSGAQGAQASTAQRGQTYQGRYPNRADPWDDIFNSLFGARGFGAAARHTTQPPPPPREKTPQEKVQALVDELSRSRFEAKRAEIAPQLENLIRGNEDLALLATGNFLATRGIAPLVRALGSEPAIQKLFMTYLDTVSEQQGAWFLGNLVDSNDQTALIAALKKKPAYLDVNIGNDGGKPLTLAESILKRTKATGVNPTFSLLIEIAPQHISTTWLNEILSSVQFSHRHTFDAYKVVDAAIGALSDEDALTLGRPIVEARKLTNNEVCESLFSKALEANPDLVSLAELKEFISFIGDQHNRTAGGRPYYERSSDRWSYMVAAVLKVKPELSVACVNEGTLGAKLGMRKTVEDLIRSKVSKYKGERAVDALHAQLLESLAT
ncbi:MAG: DnaJ domain-containing protein, partial [Alphaproteobacteria bacterium]